MIPEWVAQYVGLPFKNHGRGPEYDCWGLVRKVWADHYGYHYPDFSQCYDGSTDPAIAGAFLAGTVEHGLAKVEQEQEGDILLLTLAGRPMHCGLVVAPRTMLHARPKVGSCVESYDRPFWNRRIEGFYRPGACTRGTSG